MRVKLSSLTARLCFCVSLPLAMMSQPVLAQSTQVFSGKISSVFVSSGYNEAFRITLTQNGLDVMSICPGSFAYVNIDWPNYDAYVAELTTFYVRSTPVNVTVQRSGNGFCQMVEFGSG